MAESRENIQDEFRQHLRAADKFLAEGNFAEATNELVKARKIDPRNPFIQAFQERISHFEKKTPPGAEAMKKPEPAQPGGPVVVTKAKPPVAAGPPQTAEPGLPPEVEEEYKRKYTEELRKAEERAEKLLAEEKEKLEKNFLKQRLENEREFEKIKLQHEKDYQDRLATEIRKTEIRLEGEYQSELARLEGDLRTKLHQQFQADMVEEKERLKNELRGLADKERHSAVEMEQGLRTDFENRLAQELKKNESDLRMQLQEQHRREEEKLKIELTAEFEDRMNYERGKQKEEYDQQKKKGEDLHKIEISKSRHAQEELEKKIRDEFNRKLLESVRKAEGAYEEQAAQRMKEAQETLRSKMEEGFRQELEGERRTLKEEYEKLKASLEESSHVETSRIKEQAESRLKDQIAGAQKQLEEEFERRSTALRNELESKYQSGYETRLQEEREKIRKEADQKIAAEKTRLGADYESKMLEQSEKLKSVRKDLRAQMEAELLKRMESLAADYETKLDLLGVRLPETKAEQINYYRDAMLARFAKGSLDVEDAKKLLQLKELLGLSFDEHLTIEAEVRLKTYSDRIRQLIVSGSLDPADEKTLGKLKEKYGVTEEESKALEHHLLASFGKLRMKGRILVADDDKLLLRTIEDILTDSGYAVVTAEDIDAAIEHLRSTPFDLILSDIKFSDNEFEGFAFFKKVQAIQPYASIPFIFMSALSDGVIVRSGVQLGVDDYLTKPVEPELLIAVIEGKLKRYRAMKFQ
ncbi:MAG TPA: response regulator [Bacteroidota bacterium]|nr:response regulator [Bacteroidota bacterium]